jgi:thioredoxin-related protein
VLRKIGTLFFFISITAYAGALSWKKDLRTALEEAKKTHRPVAVLVESRFCHWCKKLHSEVLTHPEATDILKDFVRVRLDRSDKKQTALLPYVSGVPTLFFFDADGKIAGMIYGYRPFSAYMKSLHKAAEALHVSSESSLRWYDDIDKAFETARKTGKKVLVMVEDADCRWCKKVKRESLSRPDVRETLKRFVLLKISRSNPAMKRLPELYGPIPSFHLFDANRTKRDAMYGYFDADYLYDYFRQLSEE